MENEVTIDVTKIRLEKLQSALLESMKVRLHVLRADLIHPVISGNKWFKLRYTIDQALREGNTGLVTTGGAYSNHLLATAAATCGKGLQSVGIVRGERPRVLSPTLRDAEQYGMKLQFLSRTSFADPHTLGSQFEKAYPDYLWVPEGGSTESGILGASTLLDGIDLNAFSHIACAVGTGTTMAGLLRAAREGQEVIGIPVLKLFTGAESATANFILGQETRARAFLPDGYHEGGYAKYNPALLQFMNAFYHAHFIPTDFVYTGKLFLALFDLIRKGHFPEGSSLLALHSGGLQGNRSLEPGLLNF